MRRLASTGATVLWLACCACVDPGAVDARRASVDHPAGTDPAPPRAPGMSGLARYRGHLFIAVHDTKRGQAGPRLSAISLETDAPFASRPIEVDWGPAGGLPSDLEAIAPLPDRPGEYLVAESGHRDGRTGRIVCLQITGGTLEAIRARVVGAPIELPADAHRIEGLVLVPRSHDLPMLVTCERDERRSRPGGAAPGDGRHALLRWSELDLERGHLSTARHTRVRALVWPEGGTLRTCSDLHLDEEDGGATLWIAATVEPKQGGPHDSIVYRVPTSDLLTDDPGGAIMTTAWRLTGAKVEGLAPPLRPGGGLTVATDEDAAGGEVRVLPELRGPD